MKEEKLGGREPSQNCGVEVLDWNKRLVLVDCGFQHLIS